MDKNKRAYLVLFSIVFIDMVGFGIIIPLLPYYGQIFSNEISLIGSWLGLNTQPEGLVIAILFSIYSLMQLIFSPIWGKLSDKYGRKTILIWNAAGSVLSFIIFGIAGTLWVLIFSRVIQGITGAKIATAQAYIADITTAEKRAAGMGMIGAGIGLGFVFGPAITGILISFETNVLSSPFFDQLLQHNIYSLPGYFAALLALVNVGMIYFMLEEPEKHTDSAVAKHNFNLDYFRKAFRNKEIGQLLLIVFLSTAAFSAMESTFALWGNAALGIDEKTNSYLFAYIGVLIAVNQGFIVGRMATWLGEKRLIFLGTGLLMIGLFLIPFAQSVGILMLFLVLLAFGSGINTPSLQSLVSQASSAEDIGGTMGISQSTSSFARIIGPIIGGWAFDVLGISSPFLVSAGIMFLASLVALRFLFRKNS